MNEPTVVCVLCSGGEYTEAHVSALYNGVKQHWPVDCALRFVVLTDQLCSDVLPGIEVRKLWHKWPGWWAKMELFAGAQDDLGDILYIDLDTVVIGDLSDVRAIKKLTLLQDFYHPEKVSAGLMYLPRLWRPAVYAHWLSEQKDAMHTLVGDSDFLDQLWRRDAERWQTVLPGQVVSYKVDVRQRKGQTPPDNARIVCFHGKPRPWQTKLWPVNA